MGSKFCPDCDRVLPLIRFTETPVTDDGYWIRCKPCQKKHDRIRWLKSAYRMTVEEYDALLEIQEGQCALCGLSELNSPTHFSVDHDRSCCGTATWTNPVCGKCTRGLLCRTCNMRLAKRIRIGRLTARDRQYLADPPAQRLKVFA